MKAIPDPSAIDYLADLGTGAGFPGIPLKIVYPSIHVVLMDSLQKRIRFLEEVIARCELEGIEAVHGRAEDLAKQEVFREQFSVCVSRAVANLSSLSEYCLPFVRTGGQFIAYKAGDTEEEIKQAGKAVRILGGRINTEPVRFVLPGSDLNRTLVVIDKIKATPTGYPRRSGIPAKTPLGCES